jgi:zinc D-Ala-D-Ala dipeptidase
MKYDESIRRMKERREEDTLSIEGMWQVDVRECNEPLVKIVPNDYVHVALLPGRIRIPGEEAYARQSVVQALNQAGKELGKLDLALKIFDAYRPIDFQRARYKQIFEQMKSDHPQLNDDEVREHMQHMVCPPSDDPKRASPHVTGGAVDLTITNSYGYEKNMGTLYGEHGNPLVPTNAPSLSSSQRAYRDLLIEVLGNLGLTNHPKEWWHFEGGTQNNAHYLGLDFARFGGVADPYKDSLLDLIKRT